VIAIGAAVPGGIWLLRTPPPELVSVTPELAQPGATVVLSGTHLAPNAKHGLVRFGDEAGDIVSVSEASVAVRVPAQTKTGDIPVSIETTGGRSAALTLHVYRAPVVTGLSPDVALPGGEVVLTGEYLAGDALKVTIGGLRADVLSSAPNVIRVRVPVLLSVGVVSPVRVTVGPDTISAPDLALGQLPWLERLDPPAGAAGLRVRIRGRGFSADPAANAVSFGSQRAVVLSASPTELVIASGGSDGPGSAVPVSLSVEVGGHASREATFTLTRPQTGRFLPRFFPRVATEHAGHSHVFVASDLGPFMVLTGSAGTLSAGDRAMAVATALNELFDPAATDRHPEVEVRDEPVGCLGLLGRPACLVTASAEDAAGYDESWSATRSAKANPQKVAVHWSALLEDYLDVFVVGRRPHRMLETSARSKTLLNLFDRSESEPGIPLEFVSPLPSRLASELRELALVLPAEAQVKGTTAVEGTWYGRVEEKGGNPTAVKVQLRLRDGKLQGTVATHIRSVVMERPLEELGYASGELHFIARLAGEDRLLRGTLAEGQIVGTIYTRDGKSSLGQFTLVFGE
jgi:IPT/TIG domain